MILFIICYYLPYLRPLTPRSPTSFPGLFSCKAPETKWKRQSPGYEVARSLSTIRKALGRCLKKWLFTTETGRLFFRRRTKQLPLARKPNVLGHVAKLTWAHSFVLSSSVFPSRFFWILSVVDLWLLLLVQHDKDKGYHLCFSHGWKTFHIYLRKSPLLPCDFWVASGTWRNVITCAYLYAISCSARGLNSNTFLDSSDCLVRLRKNSLPVSVVLITWKCSHLAIKFKFWKVFLNWLLCYLDKVIGCQ